MTKTITRGPWPGKPSNAYKVTARKFTPADRHASVRGQTVYKEVLEKLLAGKPGAVCVEFESPNGGKAFVHAVSRYLRQQGVDKKLRPATQRLGSGSAVWVVQREEA
jgi:hypothetical protein